MPQVMVKQNKTKKLTCVPDKLAEHSDIIKDGKENELAARSVEYDNNVKEKFGVMDCLLKDIFRVFIRLKSTCNSCGC